MLMAKTMLLNDRTLECNLLFFEAELVYQENRRIKLRQDDTILDQLFVEGEEKSTS